jgi:hypothetical protein
MFSSSSSSSSSSSKIPISHNIYTATRQIADIPATYSNNNYMSAVVNGPYGFYDGAYLTNVINICLEDDCYNGNTIDFNFVADLIYNSIISVYGNTKYVSYIHHSIASAMNENDDTIKNTIITNMKNMFEIYYNAIYADNVEQTNVFQPILGEFTNYAKISMRDVVERQSTGTQETQIKHLMNLSKCYICEKPFETKPSASSSSSSSSSSSISNTRASIKNVALEHVAPIVDALFGPIGLVQSIAQGGKDQLRKKYGLLKTFIYRIEYALAHHAPCNETKSDYRYVVIDKKNKIFGINTRLIKEHTGNNVTIMSENQLSLLALFNNKVIDYLSKKAGGTSTKIQNLNRYMVFCFCNVFRNLPLPIVILMFTNATLPHIYPILHTIPQVGMNLSHNSSSAASSSSSSSAAVGKKRAAPLPSSSSSAASSSSSAASSSSSAASSSSSAAAPSIKKLKPPTIKNFENKLIGHTNSLRDSKFNSNVVNSDTTIESIIFVNILNNISSKIIRMNILEIIDYQINLHKSKLSQADLVELRSNIIRAIHRLFIEQNMILQYFNEFITLIEDKKRKNVMGAREKERSLSSLLDPRLLANTDTNTLENILGAYIYSKNVLFYSSSAAAMPSSSSSAAAMPSFSSSAAAMPSSSSSAEAMQSSNHDISNHIYTILENKFKVPPKNKTVTKIMEILEEENKDYNKMPFQTLVIKIEGIIRYMKSKAYIGGKINIIDRLPRLSLENHAVKTVRKSAVRKSAVRKSAVRKSAVRKSTVRKSTVKIVRKSASKEMSELNNNDLRYIVNYLNNNYPVSANRIDSIVSKVVDIYMNNLFDHTKISNDYIIV